jgi:hypothetical protein
MIEESSSRRFVSDTEKATWNAKAAVGSTAPSTQAYGDSAVVGTSGDAARADHKHAMPASVKDTTAVTGLLKGNGATISAASAGTDYEPARTTVSQATAEAGTSTTVYAWTPERVAQAIAALASGGAQIATGSYTGTGTYGSSSPTAITVGFQPKLVIIRSTKADYNVHTMILVHGSTRSLPISLRENKYCTVTFTATGASWYSSGAYYQMNESGSTYYYVAIG